MIELLNLFKNIRTLEKYKDNDKILIDKIIEFINLDILFWDFHDKGDINNLLFASELVADARDELTQELSTSDSMLLENLDTPDNSISVKAKLYSIGIKVLNDNKTFPLEISDELYKIYCDSINTSKNMREKFETAIANNTLINDLYDKNGVEGLAKFIVIDRHLFKNHEERLFNLYNKSEAINSDTIINLTSSESVLNEHTFSQQADILIDAYKTNQGELLSKPHYKKIIYL